MSLVLIVLMLGAGLGGAYVLIQLAQEPSRRTVEVRPPFVETVVVQSEDVVKWFEGYGTVRAIRRARLAAEVSGPVLERVDDLRNGADVSEGQVLIRLDDRSYRQAYKRAQALADAQMASIHELEVEAENLKILIGTAREELRVAESEKARLTRLFERQLAAKKEYDVANLAFRQSQRILQEYERELARIAPQRTRLLASHAGSQADAALAKINIERCEIHAPFSGRVEEVSVEVGDHVAPGVVAVTLVDRSRLEIPIELPGSAYKAVRIGAECRMESESNPAARWSARVSRVAPEVDTESRTFAVYVVVERDDRQSGLVPGMFIQAKVRGPTLPASLVVPRSACREGSLMVVEGSVVRKRRVTIRDRIQDLVVVGGGIQPGDRVLATYPTRLADGSPVRYDTTLSEAARAPTSSNGGN